MINKRKLGAAYEIKAAAYLEKMGYTIVEKNYRCRIGEIDIVVRDNPYLVFVEVKYRTDSKMGYPIEAVDSKKQCKISKVADYYRMCHGLPEDTACRFDVVVVMEETISHYKNAFEYRQH